MSLLRVIAAWPELPTHVQSAILTLVDASTGRAVCAGGLSSPRDLARKHGVDPEALRKRLERFRLMHDVGSAEVHNRRPNEPKFLYDEAAVLPVIYQLQSVDRRPAAIQQDLPGHRVA
jgi:hypothetical protein